jgi:DNA-binding HxlR family transcriptional regulator
MATTTDNPFAALQRVLHEPHRLALVSALAPAVDGLSFNELKGACDLTDGNLNRHLKALEDEGIISQRKAADKGRPRTTVTLTPTGRKRFVKYLETLEEVLVQAAASVGAESTRRAGGSLFSTPRPSRA